MTRRDSFERETWLAVRDQTQSKSIFALNVRHIYSVSDPLITDLLYFEASEWSLT